MKLLQDGDGKVVLHAASAPMHTIIDDVLPPALRGGRASRADLEQFLFMLHIALAPPDAMKAAIGATQSNPAKLAVPQIDEGHFLLVEAGKFQHERLRILARIVGYRWHQPPPPGLLWSMVTTGQDYDSLERNVESYEQSKLKQTNEALSFIEIMLPPEYQSSGRAMSPSESAQVTHTIMRWVLKHPPEPGQQVDRHRAMGDLQELGLRANNGDLDRRRARLAAKFIWGAEAGEPSFQALKSWLSAIDREEEKKAGAQTAALRKKRKVAKKRRRNGRR